jgi:hypothetical protein
MKPTISYANNVGVIHPNGIATLVAFVSFRRLDLSAAEPGDVSLYRADGPDQNSISQSHLRTMTQRSRCHPLDRRSTLAITHLNDEISFRRKMEKTKSTSPSRFAPEARAK